MDDELKFGGCAILFAVGFIAIMCAVGYYINQVTCFSKASDMDLM